MRISVVQTAIIWENKETNIKRAEKIINEQKKIGVELILFPEMSFTGFSMNIELTAEDGRDTVKRLSDIAGRKEVAVGFGWVRRTGDKCENVYTILDKEGSLISEYVKIHPFSYSGEDKKFRGGDKISTYNIYSVPFSTFICYDLRFPEIFRAVAEDVSAIIIPANWPAKRAEHWKALLKARAIENQVYIFGVNCQGDMGGEYYSGDSCVINPDGQVVEMISDREGIIVYDLVNDVFLFRKAFPVMKDRRKDMYENFKLS